MSNLSSPSLWRRPSKRLGWWSVGLAAVFLVMFIINSLVFMLAGQNTSNDWWRQSLLPFYGIFMLLCGLASVVIGLAAVITKHERSWLVWLIILPGAFVLCCSCWVSS
jgi:succinate dehydrogenase hydrophobic anchor subunit